MKHLDAAQRHNNVVYPAIHYLEWRLKREGSGRILVFVDFEIVEEAFLAAWKMCTIPVGTSGHSDGPDTPRSRSAPFRVPYRVGAQLMILLVEVAGTALRSRPRSSRDPVNFRQH